MNVYTTSHAGVAQTPTSALMPITERPDAVMVRGEGSYLWDSKGKQYLDFVQGWAVNALGHCPPEIVQALTAQANLLISPSPALHNAPQLALAEKLASTSGLAQVHFANSGGEANEAAVKLARKWGQIHRKGAFEIITTHGAFHGRTLAMMAASGKPGWDTLFAPEVPGFRKVPFGEVEKMGAAITDTTVALMVEPIQGEAGVVVPPAGYLKSLRALADTHGILLILDEVQTGIGRTGALYAFQHEDVLPDILTLAKGLGGGVPISAMLSSEEVSCFSPGDQGGTYNGNPLMTAAALAVVNTVSPSDFLSNVCRLGNYMQQAMVGLGKQAGIREVRGTGLLWAARLPQPNARAVAARAFEQGLLVNAVRSDTLRLMPSLRVTPQEIDDAMAILVNSIEQA